MPIFETSFTVHAPLEAVSRFHHNTIALKKLTPPPVIVQMERIEPLAEGSLSQFVLWFGPFPVRWLACHYNVDPQTGFSDVQVHGPMQTWRHTHRFEALDAENTRVHEHIEYAYPSGLKGLLPRLLFSPLALRGMFAYRAWVTRRSLQSAKAAG